MGRVHGRLFILVIGWLAISTALHAQGIDLSGTWILDKSEGKVSRPNTSAAPQAPSGGGGYPGGTFPGRLPGGQNRGNPRDLGGGGSMPLPELGGPPEEDVKLRIVQSSAEVKIERRWIGEYRPQAITQTFTLDGKQTDNPAPSGGVMTTRARWNKSTFVVEGTQQLALGNRDVDLRIKEEYSLSKDGKTLTVKTRRATPRGQSETRQTFKREPEGK